MEHEFKTGAPHDHGGDAAIPDRISTTAGKTRWSRWYHHFNYGGPPLVSVRCGQCPKEHLLGEVDLVDGSLVLGAKAPSNEVTRFAVLTVGEGAHAEAYREASEPLSALMCPNRHADPRDARLRLIEGVSQRRRTVRI